MFKILKLWDPNLMGLSRGLCCVSVGRASFTPLNWLLTNFEISLEWESKGSVCENGNGRCLAGSSFSDQDQVANPHTPTTNS